jgi:hypothetical protein
MLTTITTDAGEGMALLFGGNTCSRPVAERFEGLELISMEALQQGSTLEVRRLTRAATA